MTPCTLLHSWPHVCTGLLVETGGAVAAGTTGQSGQQLQQTGAGKPIGCEKAGMRADISAEAGMSQLTVTAATEIDLPATGMTGHARTGTDPGTGQKGLTGTAVAGKMRGTGDVRTGTGMSPETGITGAGQRPTNMAQTDTSPAVDLLAKTVTAARQQMLKSK